MTGIGNISVEQLVDLRRVATKIFDPDRNIIKFGLTDTESIKEGISENIRENPRFKNVMYFHSPEVCPDTFYNSPFYKCDNGIIEFRIDLRSMPDRGGGRLNLRFSELRRYSSQGTQETESVMFNDLPIGQQAEIADTLARFAINYCKYFTGQPPTEHFDFEEGCNDFKEAMFMASTRNEDFKMKGYYPSRLSQIVYGIRLGLDKTV